MPKIQILKFNGNVWVPSNFSALSYGGNWNATLNAPDLTTGGSPGVYYIVNLAGTYNLNGGPGTNSRSASAGRKNARIFAP